MSLWDDERIERYIRLYNDPRQMKGSQSSLCEDVSRMIQGASVADFGCGMGHLIPYLKPETKYIGIDSSKLMLKKASEFFPGKQFLLADVTDQKSLSELYGIGFDNTVAVSLLLHLEKLDALDLLEIMWRYTNPGGMMIFSMETNGDSEQRRPDGLLIRNQEPESVVQDVLTATRNSNPSGWVRYHHQKATISILEEINYLKTKVKIIGMDQVARTSIFWAIKKAS